jgi:tetratricopeptide (TPR) repeat protein
VQERTSYEAAQAVVLHAEGKMQESLAAAEQALEAIDAIGAASQPVKVALPQALEVALTLGNREHAEQLLERVETLPTGRFPPSLRAQAARFRARLSVADGDHQDAERQFLSAAAIFREYGLQFWLAQTLTEHGEWLDADGQAEQAQTLLDQAIEILSPLQTRTWLARATRPASRTSERDPSQAAL